MVILHITIPPAVTGFGEQTTELICSGCTVRVNVFARLAAAATVTVVAGARAVAVAVNDPVVDPAAIVTDAGTVTVALLLVNETTFPPAGAAPVSVAVQVTRVPAIIYGEAHATLLTLTSGLSTTPVLSVLPLYEALTAALVAVVTLAAVIVNFAEALFAGTVTDAGTLSLPTEDDTATVEDSATDEPPAGAAPDNVTVQVEVPGVAIVTGLQDSAESVTVGAGFTLSAIAFEVPPKDAVSCAVMGAATADAVAAKVVDVAPAGTATDAGTLT
jgi:hypothetical protein